MGTSGALTVVNDSSRKAVPPIKRQHRSPELKQQVVEESFAPGASVARVARAHGVNANQVFTWRRQYRQGLLKAAHSATPTLLAVRVTKPEPEGRGAEPRRPAVGVIQVELPKGKLRLTGAVDAEALQVVLGALLR